MFIEDLKYRIVFDSRGKETVECEVVSSDFIGRAIAPSGASKGSYEAIYISPYKFKEVGKKISNALIGINVFEQEEIDKTLKDIDGTENFSKIGANFAIATSLACSKLAATILGVPLYQYLGGILANELPYPLGNVIGGGAHAIGSTSIQEFLIIPTGAKSFFEAQLANSKVYRMLGKEFRNRKIFAAKGDEGAWAAKITDDEAFELLSSVIEKIEEEIGLKIKMGLDLAANELWNGEYYVYANKKLTREDQISYVSELIDKYELLYVEDPLHENDFEGFAELTKNNKCMICGDDIFATNPRRIKKGIEMKAANTVLIKPNQIGTLTDVIEAVKLCKKSEWDVVVSHRSGETEDESIAHLSVAFNATLIKSGVVSGERTVKLNELIRIEDELKNAKMVKIKRCKD